MEFIGQDILVEQVDLVEVEQVLLDQDLQDNLEL